MYNWIPAKVEQAQKKLASTGNNLNFKFNTPAEPSEIHRCEENLGFCLPASFKEFLMFSNGANIFCNTQSVINDSRGANSSWYADSGILIQNTVDLLEFNRLQDVVYVDENCEKKYIAFAYLGYIGTGDFCSFDTATFVNAEYKVLDCDHDYSYEDWHESHIIANSFDEWLVKMFDEVIQNTRRPEYWIPTSLT
jgi:hypothetical protein